MDISLRPITKSDTKDIVRWRNSPQVKNHFIDRTVLTEEIHENWLKNYVETGKCSQFIIIDKNNKGIGTAYLRDIDKKNSKAELGIYIGEKNLQSKGLGCEAVRLLCNYGFDKLGLHKIFLRVMEKNIRAIKCYEKMGFKHEGVFQDDVLVDDSYVNITFMALIK